MGGESEKDSSKEMCVSIRDHYGHRPMVADSRHLVVLMVEDNPSLVLMVVVMVGVELPIRH